MRNWVRWTFTRLPLRSYSLLSSCCGAFEIQDLYPVGLASFQITSINFHLSSTVIRNENSVFISSVKIGDATPGVIIVVIAYMLPARPTFWCLKTGQKEIDRKPSASVLDWRYTQKHFPWNALLLLGIYNLEVVKQAKYFMPC